MVTSLSSTVELSGIRALVVDDSAVALVLLKNVLEKIGLCVITASGCKEAISLLEEDPAINLAFIDWIMPEMDGLELCKYIRNSPKLEELYVVMCTAKSEIEDIEHAIDAGANDYIVKPIKYKQVRIRTAIAAQMLKTRAALTDLHNSLEDKIALRTEELQKTEKEAVDATNRKSEFLANMSHEIRTPLNAIMSLGALLERSNLDIEQREDVESLNIASETLKTLIGDVLDFSKIEAGKLAILPRRFAPDTVLTRVESIFQVEAKQKDISLRFETVQLPSRLVGDSNRIQQVVANLVDNALKFTPNGGSVVVRMEAKTIRENTVLLSVMVEDTGVGVETELRESVFEPYRQADSSASRSFGGTGLGLAISRQLARLMNGDLTCEEPMGRTGSLFRFSATLPIDDRKNFKSGVHQTISKGNGARILIVDDNEINRTTLRRLLNEAGYFAECVANGDDAIRYLASQEVELVLMDLQMPGMGGIEATESIRRDSEYGRTLPIVALTAFAIEEQREKSIKAGMNGFLTKPIDFSELLQTIREFV